MSRNETNTKSKTPIIMQYRKLDAHILALANGYVNSFIDGFFTVFIVF